MNILNKDRFSIKGGRTGDDPPLLFILASPRTGSTFLYQLLINTYDFIYINNLINDRFSKSIASGIYISKLAGGFNKKISYNSSYGKTKRWYEPSEGSMVFGNWYGGSHPSEIYSANPKNAKSMSRDIMRAYKVSRVPIIFKNAWNCFRIKDLSHRYPNAFFIWLRRDIVKSASSDLESRNNQGSPYIWNSATTRNYKDLFDLEPYKQSVEQQFYFNKSIEKNLNKYSEGRFCELWYEDLCSNIYDEVGRIEQLIAYAWNKKIVKNKKIDIDCISKNKSLKLNKDILNYVYSQRDRFVGLTKDDYFR